MIKATNISKRFGEIQVLKELNLIVNSGESVAIMGRSGEGKTTLLHVLGSLVIPDSGTLEINHKEITKANANKIKNEEIGFIFQSYNLLEDFTALENVLMPARIARRNPSKEMGLELLDRVGLREKANISSKFLSGGERQRVAIARALCNDPNLILADEPTGNLDRANAQKIGQLLLSLNKSLIIVTHDKELAALCERQLDLQDGSLLPSSHFSLP